LIFSPHIAFPLFPQPQLPSPIKQSIIRYIEQPWLCWVRSISHLIITHMYYYFPPVKPFGVPFSLVQSPCNLELSPNYTGYATSIKAPTRTTSSRVETKPSHSRYKPQTAVSRQLSTAPWSPPFASGLRQ
jgi:hypothetical protein